MIRTGSAALLFSLAAALIGGVFTSTPTRAAPVACNLEKGPAVGSSAARANPGSATTAAGCTEPPRPAPPNYVVLDDGSRLYPPSNVPVGAVSDALYQSTHPECEGSCSSGLVSGESNATVFDNLTAADASTVTAPPGVQVTPDSSRPATGTPLMKTFHKDDAFGNDNFGADYSLDATLNATPASGSVGAQLRATADLKVNATAFGSRNQLFRALVTPMSDQTGAIGVNAKLYLAGQEVYSKNYTTITFNETKLFSHTILPRINPSQPPSAPGIPPLVREVTVFGVKIRVGAGIYNEGGYAINGQLTVAGFRVNYIPESRMYATLSGAVLYEFYNPYLYSLLYIRFDDVLNLINVKQPYTLDVFGRSCNTIDWKLQMNQTLNTLSGKVTVRVFYNRLLNYFPYYIQLDRRFTLARYSGTTVNIPLVSINDSGTPLDFICTSAVQDAILTLNPPPTPSVPPTPSPRPPGGGPIP